MDPVATAGPLGGAARHFSLTDQRPRQPLEPGDGRRPAIPPGPPPPSADRFVEQRPPGANYSLQGIAPANRAGLPTAPAPGPHPHPGPPPPPGQHRTLVGGRPSPPRRHSSPFGARPYPGQRPVFTRAPTPGHPGPGPHRHPSPSRVPPHFAYGRGGFPPGRGHPRPPFPGRGFVPPDHAFATPRTSTGTSVGGNPVPFSPPLQARPASLHPGRHSPPNLAPAAPPSHQRSASVGRPVRSSHLDAFDLLLQSATKTAPAASDALAAASPHDTAGSDARFLPSPPPARPSPAFTDAPGLSPGVRAALPARDTRVSASTSAAAPALDLSPERPERPDPRVASQADSQHRTRLAELLDEIDAEAPAPAAPALGADSVPLAPGRAVADPAPRVAASRPSWDSATPVVGGERSLPRPAPPGTPPREDLGGRVAQGIASLSQRIGAMEARGAGSLSPVSPGGIPGGQPARPIGSPMPGSLTLGSPLRHTVSPPGALSRPGVPPESFFADAPPPPLPRDVAITAGYAPSHPHPSGGHAARNVSRPRPNGEIVSTLGTETLPGTIGADLMAMLERKLLCDVVLVVVDRRTREEREFRAHKILLAARSDYFRMLFLENQGRGTFGSLIKTSVDQLLSGGMTRVRMEHDHEAIAEVISFIYSDTCKLTSSNVWNLMEAAEEFSLLHLRRECYLFIQQSINESTACEYLGHAEKVRNTTLADYCRAVIRERFRAAAQSPGWLRLDESTIASLLSDRNLCAPEIVVFRGAVRWCRADASRAPSGPRVLSLVRYPLMSEQQLTGEVDVQAEVKASHDLTRRVLDALKQKITATAEDIRQLRRQVLFPGVIFDVPTSELREEGWRDLHAQAYADPIDSNVLQTAATFEFVLLGARRRGADRLQVCAMGRSSEAFRVAEVMPGQVVSGVVENGVHFYYVPGRVLGFADGSDAVRLTADVDDEVGEHRLCWSLVPGRGGWRAGEDRNLGQSREYEKVIMVWQQP